MDKWIIDLAAKLITAALRRAILDPDKRAAVLSAARQMVSDVSMLIAQVETLRASDLK